MRDIVILLELFENQLGLRFSLDVIPYTVCSEEQSLLFPDINFNIDGILYTLPRESYIIYEEGVCALKIMTTESMNVWILGLNFFENYYTIFDQENRRVGFAPSIHAQPSLSNLNLVEEVS